jgi:group I intron endonuclease
MIGIYKITNPKGKIYIGQSTNIEERWEKGHKYGSGCGIKLKNSFKKYGWENHKKEIIEECSIKDLSIRETYWIEYHNSYKKGLNSIPGGGVQGYKDEQWRKNHSKGLKGRKGAWEGKKRPEHSEFLKKNGSGLSYKRTQEHKDNLKKKLSGKKLSKEHCEKISQNKIGKKTKKIICLETNQIFNSIKECSELLNISKGCICSFVKGKYPYPKLKGYTFKYC